MAEPLAQYSPDLVYPSFKGVPLSGFQDGTFIEAERSEPGYHMHVDTLGNVARSRNLNRTGKITFTSTQYASVNALLQAIYNEDEQFGTGVGSFLVKDLSSNAMCHASQAWIEQVPKWGRAKEANENVVWVFMCADIQIIHAGNLIVPGNAY